jgi:hypothetical protein
MSRSGSLRLAALLGTLVTTAAVTLPAPASTAAPARASASGDHPATVATGLDNPRLLSFGSDGGLYVAEAGTGGDGPCVASAEGGEACFGRTGAITRLRHGRTQRVVTGLPSLADHGNAALGPADVQVHGHRYLVSMGLGNNPAVRRNAEMPRAARKLATLLEGRLGRHGQRVVADLGQFEADHDPVGEVPDTDPTGFTRVRHGVVITDSGGNDLLKVGRHGKISTLAVFPDRIVPFPTPTDEFPMQAVPTSVVRGPDGALYVSQLTGFPFPVGAANIYRVVPGHEPTVYASGLTNVTDLTWSHGRLYAVQIAADGLDLSSEAPPVGSLVKIVKGAPVTVAGELTAPYGVAVKGRSAYVTTCAVCPGQGAVVRVSLR